MLLATLGLALLMVQEPAGPIETCRIEKMDDRAVVLVCKEDKATGAFSGYVIPGKPWPEEWEDSTKVGDSVKLQPIKSGWLPIASCKVRIAKVEEAARRNRVGERRMPTNWYLPKDCPGGGGQP